jgi:hypothetical protein
MTNMYRGKLYNEGNEDENSTTYPNTHNDKQVGIQLITSSFPYLEYTQTYDTFLHILKTRGIKTET